MHPDLILRQGKDDRKALKYGNAREASPDLAAGELEFTDDKVRVGLMFSLLDNFVEWGNGGGVQERAVVILTYFQDACHARQRVACILISSYARESQKSLLREEKAAADNQEFMEEEPPVDRTRRRVR